MIRVALLLPEVASLPASEVIPRVIEELVPQVAAAALRRPRSTSMIALVAHGVRPRRRLVAPWPLRPAITGPEPSIAAAVRVRVGVRDHARARTDAIPSPVAPPVVARGTSRLSGSVWMLARGGPAGTVSGGQLGASQGGLRVVYALGHRRRFAVIARVATPLQGKGREAAVGIEWQPTRLPIRLVAEQRFVLDGGRGGPTLGVIAGYGPSDIAPGVRVEAYGQAGGIVRDRIEGFVDASARLTHPLGKVAGAGVDIGVGAWGSAQRDASRFDIGPSIIATLPVAGKTLRLTLDWRERIAGGARPGSGPALSIGSDF